VVDLVVFVEFVMGFCWFVVAGGELWWSEDMIGFYFFLFFYFIYFF
jgi:hypothetical protein